MFESSFQALEIHISIDGRSFSGADSFDSTPGKESAIWSLNSWLFKGIFVSIYFTMQKTMVFYVNDDLMWRVHEKTFTFITSQTTF